MEIGRDVGILIFTLTITAQYCSGLQPSAGETKQLVDVKKYLYRFGYSTTPNPIQHSFSSRNSFRTAVSRFQKFAGLKETGEIDEDTMSMMRLPRCGAPDVTSSYAASPSQQKWMKYHLTYFIQKYTLDLQKAKVEEIFNEAFQLWSNVTPLTFNKSNTSLADIVILFDKGDHGDGFNFDGPGQTLAHAFSPPDGDTHFDDDEIFTHESNNGVNLLWVAAHEFGHALGLSHTAVEGSVMYPFYRGYRANFTLHQVDVNNIRALYGTTIPTTPVPMVTTKPVCKDNLPIVLCTAWRNSGYCLNHARVQIECKQTCNKC